MLTGCERHDCLVGYSGSDATRFEREGRQELQQMCQDKVAGPPSGVMGEGDVG